MGVVDYESMILCSSNSNSRMHGVLDFLLLCVGLQFAIKYYVRLDWLPCAFRCWTVNNYRFFLAARYIKGRRVFDYGWASLLGLGPQRESFDTLSCYSGLD
jgi:hypothetical protein